MRPQRRCEAASVSAFRQKRQWATPWQRRRAIAPPTQAAIRNEETHGIGDVATADALASTCGAGVARTRIRVVARARGAATWPLHGAGRGGRIRRAAGM